MQILKSFVHCLKSALVLIPLIRQIARSTFLLLCKQQWVKPIIEEIDIICAIENKFCPQGIEQKCFVLQWKPISAFEEGVLSVIANYEIVHERDSIHVKKETGTEVNYYIFDEAEIHLNTIMPHTIQEWHFHKKIDESILITKGRLLCKFVDDNGIEKSCYATKNDIVRVHNSIHTFENDTDEMTEFVVFRFVPAGTNKRELIKNDKTVVRR